MPEIQTIKISELPETSNLNGLRTLGTTADNQSMALQLQAVADATANANDAATQAQEAAQTANEAAQTANTAASAANQATDNVIDAINKTEAAYTNATAAAESANEAAAAANSAADQAIGFINSAQTAVDNANTAANAANEAATTATNAANNANTQAEYAKEQGDYAKQQGDYAKQQGDYAKQQGDAVLAQKGQPNGLAELDSTGRVPAGQLPGFVDDVINVDTYNDLPNPGEDSKIYITIDTNLQYRWGGESYVILSPSLALGTTSETAGRGDWTQAAYNHSLITNGSNPHKTTFSSLPDAPTSLPANGGNADTVDNLHASSFARTDQNPNVDLNTVNGFGIMSNYGSAFATPENNYPINLAGTLFYGNAVSDSSCQIYGAYNVNRWFVRAGKTAANQKTEWQELWHTGNLNPVTIDSDQIITGWKRFTPKTKNGVYNTSGKLGTKDTYGTPFSWNVKSGGSIWNVQQESDLVTLIGVQNGRAIKLHSGLSESQITADKFNGTATKAQQDGNGNQIDTTYISFNNTTEYTPTSQFNPATKGYVDSLARTYILDMDNIFAHISSDGSTPISQDNLRILQSIRLLIIANKMPRVFGQSTVEDEEVLNGCSTCLSWQLTVGAPLKEVQGAVFLSFTCIAGSYPFINLRGTSLIFRADNTVLGFEDSGWIAIGGSSTDIIATKIKDIADNTNKQIWTGTQAEYDAISTKDSNTIYFIV